MGEIYNLWDCFFKSLPKIKEHIEAVAIKNGLDVNSALSLIVVNNYPNQNFCINENSVKVLCDKGLCEYNENVLRSTTRGAILSKSLTMTFKNI